MSSASDDSSDEEYEPQEEDSDIPSEAETDYDSDGNKISKVKTDDSQTKKRRKKQVGKREKRHNLTEATKKEIEREKVDLEEDDEEAKRRSDALWASFLTDTNSSSKDKIEIESDTKSDVGQTSINVSSSTKEPVIENKPAEKFITKVFDFAGEEIKVTEKITEPEPQNSKSSSNKAPLKKFGFGAPRASSGGLGSALSQLGKKGKISTLEKTKLDWMAYKKDEGIEEELQTHNKGKDGYLERQDFLERTDLRQFERERDLRQSKRGNR